MLPYPQTYATWLAVLRIYTGIFWLLHGVPKVLNPDITGMVSNMLQQATQSGSGWYHDFLVNTVIPNASVFAHLVAWGETLTGVSLLLGLFTRLGGLVGVFLPLNYWAMKSGWTQAGNFGSMDWAAIALSFINLVLPTGLVLGVDGLIARRRSGREPAAGKAAT